MDQVALVEVLPSTQPGAAHAAAIEDMSEGALDQRAAPPRRHANADSSWPARVRRCASSARHPRAPSAANGRDLCRRPRRRALLARRQPDRVEVARRRRPRSPMTATMRRWPTRMALLETIPWPQRGGRPGSRNRPAAGSARRSLSVAAMGALPCLQPSRALGAGDRTVRQAIAAAPVVDLAAANAWAGHDKQAKDAVARLRKARPGFTMQRIRARGSDYRQSRVQGAVCAHRRGPAQGGAAG